MKTRSFIVVAVLVAALVGLAAGVYAYDRSTEDQIAEGVKIGGVDVGGMSEDEARDAVREELLVPLQRRITVRAADIPFHLSAREAKVRADVDATVAAALERSREGNIIGRTWRGVTGGEIDEEITPRVVYNVVGVRRLVDRVRVKVSEKPKDAQVQMSATAVTVRRGEPGRTIDPVRLRKDVEAALVDPTGQRKIVAKVKKVQPLVTTKDLAKKYPTIIAVNRSGHTLRLFKNLKLSKSYGIAVGQAGLETPAGRYNIENKAINPAWHVPNSAWAGDLAGTVVPPGPSNPIKARWMGIYAGAGIHGTDAVGSIGTNASHGCIRMTIPDVEDLYDRVDVGTPVYIS